MKENSAERIKRPILVPVAISICVFLASALIMIAWLQKKQIKESIYSHIESTRVLYEGTLHDEVNLIKALLDFHKDDQSLIKAFRAKDRKTLFELANPIFKDFRKKYQITHFYFIEPDKRAFLRMYNPERYGDVIHRYTLEQAEKKGEAQSGVELGSSGTLTLRVDMPWKVDGELIGYIEFGKEIDHIVPSLSIILGLDLLVIVETGKLDRRRWEKGRELMGHEARWDELSGHVVIARTIEGVPKGLDKFLASYHQGNKDLLLDVNYGDRHFRGGVIPIFAGDGDMVGEIITMSDFSLAEHSMQMLTGILVSMVVIMSAFLFVFVYGVISRVEQRLRYSREELQHEIKERVKAEKQILAALNEKQVLLNEIHHRVKNNMQIVCSLFRMQLTQIKDPKVAAILRDSQSRISAMALIHKTLYQPKDQSSVHFEEYIKELAASIVESYGVDPELITLKCDLDRVALDIDTVTPCGLIINELVTNSIKYAFPEGRPGEVCITFKCLKKGEYMLGISDNGVGLPPDLDIRQSRTLGLHLSLNLAENQLRGRFEVESNENGTTVMIFFNDQLGKSQV